MFIVERVGTPRWIVCFPTKDDWRGASRLEWVRDGLVDLRRDVEARGIRSIAVPALGCGLGGLDWGEVGPVIDAALAPVVGLRTVVFGP